jgi:hypothetical protein
MSGGDPYADRRKLTFEQAEGVEPLPMQLKLKELSPAIRAALWSFIHGSISQHVGQTGYGTPEVQEPWRSILRYRHVYRLHEPVDEFKEDPRTIMAELKSLVMNGDYAVLYVSIGSLLVAIGSLVVSIAARQEARHHTVFTPRTQALDHLRIAINDIKRVRRVTPAAVLIMRDAKSRADLAFDEKVRSDLDRVIQIADRLQFRLLSQNESDVEALLRDLDQITRRMSETAAFR